MVGASASPKPWDGFADRKTEQGQINKFHVHNADWEPRERGPLSRCCAAALPEMLWHFVPMATKPGF